MPSKVSAKQEPFGVAGQFSNYPYDDIKVPSSKYQGWDIAASVFSPGENFIKASKALPVIVLAHGIGAIRFAGLQHFAESFAKAGYFAVTLDYIYWGDSDGLPRNHMSVSQQVQDYKDVIQWVRTHGAGTAKSATSISYKWDPESVAIWGTSFAGMHVTALLAEDQKLAAGIAQCPCVDGFAAAMKIPKLHLLRMSSSIVQDQVYASLGKNRVYVGLTDEGVPGKGSLMPGPEAIQGKANIVATTSGASSTQLLELSSSLDKITARSLMNVMLSRPVTKAKKITAPFLVVLPEYDNQAPLEAAEKAARVAAKGEVIRAKGGHFDIYYGCVGYEENINGQMEFLARVFPSHIKSEIAVESVIAGEIPVAA